VGAYLTNTARALYEFWSSFGLPAYTEGTVPTDAQVPYITYNLVETEPFQPLTHYARVWYRTTGNRALLEKVDQILSAFAARDAVKIDCDGGSVVLRGPTVQIMRDANPENSYAYISMQINSYHL